MRKLFHVYRDTSTTITARTHSADFSNVGFVTHLLISWTGTHSSGTGGTTILNTSLVDASLEGHGKIIDNLTLEQLAGICDLEGGAVIFKEGAASALPTLQMAIPIGALDLSDDTLKVRIMATTNAATASAQTMSIALACVKDMHEIGYFQYERTSLAFTAANQRLQKDFRAYGYDRIYLNDSSGVLSQFEVKPDIGQESYGYVEALQAMNYCLTAQEAFTSAPTAWNKTYLLSDESGFSADAAQVSVAAIATGSGTIEILTRRRIYRPEKVLKSMQNYRSRRANVRMIESQVNPQALKAKSYTKLVTKGANTSLVRY